MQAVTTPADTERATDVVIEIVRYMTNRGGGVNDKESIDIIAAALTEARRAQLDDDINAICYFCAHGVEYVDGMHRDPETDDWRNCNAIALHRARRAAAPVRERAGVE